MHPEILDLKEVVIFLVTAGLIIPIVERLKISPTLGFLTVGLLIGPFGLGQFVDQFPWLRYVTFSDIQGVKALAELGVVFLLFMIGLDLSIERLWSMRRMVFGLGVAQVAVTATAIGGIAFAFGNDVRTSMVVGLALALSSTALVMQLLTEGRRLGTVVGRTSFAILLAQDIAVIPILFVVSQLGNQADASTGQALVLALGQAVVAITVIMVLGRLVIRPFFRFISASQTPELFVAAVLLIIIISSVITAQAGLSLALGAFLAGLLFAETEYRHEIEVDIRPFKGLLLGLFFLSVGMGLDLAEVAAQPMWLLLGVVGLFALKSLIISMLARLFGIRLGEAVETGLLLGQGGEFAFVVVGLATTLGIVPPNVALFMLLVTGVTMALTPFMPRLARAVREAINRHLPTQEHAPMADLPDDLEDHVIIAGYGRVGRMLGSLLGEQRVAHVGLETDAGLVSEYRNKEAAVFFGDASRPDILRRACAGRARALVVTLNDPDGAERIITVVRRKWPSLPIFARARDATHANVLLKMGATDAIPETIEASLQLGEVMLEGIGFPDEAARALVEERRLIERARIANKDHLG